MYHAKSKFKLLDRDYNAVQVITGYVSLLRSTIGRVLTGEIGNSFNDAKPPVGQTDIWPDVKPTALIVVDEDGKVVPYYHIWNDAGCPSAREFQRKSRKCFRRSLPKGCEFRKDPVPYTGVRRKCNHERKPRFMQELKASIDDTGYLRPKRQRELLTKSDMLLWDDEIRGDYFIYRSWKKRKKKRQWM